MELDKKTTILFTRDEHSYLTRLAKERSKSLGQLVREACHEVYGGSSPEARLRAVAELRALSLPVSDPAQMKSESLPSYKPLP